MTEVISSFVTINCDGCEKTLTFPQTKEGYMQALEENLWLNSQRMIVTVDGRKLNYCSDECEAKGISTGNHNKLEPKRIIGSGNQAQVDLAAKAAAQAAAATAAMKQGTGITIQQ